MASGTAAATSTAATLAGIAATTRSRSRSMRRSRLEPDRSTWSTTAPRLLRSVPRSRPSWPGRQYLGRKGQVDSGGRALSIGHALQRSGSRRLDALAALLVKTSAERRCTGAIPERDHPLDGDPQPRAHNTGRYPGGSAAPDRSGRRGRGAHLSGARRRRRGDSRQRGARELGRRRRSTADSLFPSALLAAGEEDLAHDCHTARRLSDLAATRDQLPEQCGGRAGAGDARGAPGRCPGRSSTHIGAPDLRPGPAQLQLQSRARRHVPDERALLLHDQPTPPATSPSAMSRSAARTSSRSSPTATGRRSSTRPPTSPPIRSRSPRSSPVDLTFVVLSLVRTTLSRLAMVRRWEGSSRGVVRLRRMPAPSRGSGDPRVRSGAAALSALPDRRPGRGALGGADLGRGVSGGAGGDDRLIGRVEPGLRDGARCSSGHRGDIARGCAARCSGRAIESWCAADAIGDCAPDTTQHCPSTPAEVQEADGPRVVVVCVSEADPPACTAPPPGQPSPYPRGCDNSPMITVRVIGFVASLVPPGFGPGAGGFELPTRHLGNHAHASFRSVRRSEASRRRRAGSPRDRTGHPDPAVPRLQLHRRDGAGDRAAAAQLGDRACGAIAVPGSGERGGSCGDAGAAAARWIPWSPPVCRPVADTRRRPSTEP